MRLFDLDNKHLEEAKQHYRRSDRLISLVSVAAFDISQGAVLGFGAYLCATNQGVTPGGIFMAALLMGYIGLPMEEVPPVIAARKASPSSSINWLDFWQKRQMKRNCLFLLLRRLFLLTA